MRSLYVVILLGTTSSRDSMNKLVNKFVDELRLFDRAVTDWSLHHADLDHTIVGKTGELAVSPGSTGLAQHMTHRTPYSMLIDGVGKGRLVSFKPSRGNLLPLVQERDEVRVWLPPGYEKESTRYPAVFCHDGQNMMDAKSSWLGISWQLGATTSIEIENGAIQAPILVLIPNLDRLRYMEYDWGTPMNEAYINWICDVLKPAIDSKFRTLPNATYALGSSLGGTISFTSCYLRPDVFKGAACLSPVFSALYITELALNGRQFRAPGGRCKEVRLYIDNGGDGNTDDTRVSLVDWEDWNAGRGLPSLSKGFFWLDTYFQQGINGAMWALSFNGFKPGSDRRLVYCKFAGDPHNERAWARRVPGALRFLLGTTPRTSVPDYGPM